ncbi:MAG: hypothetical protein U9P79_02885, partial [Candidatus Cloacimonadota bacterium]|nr:hypothetical protein [Candidatus Cloacimonadota bacterium]
MLKKHLYLFLIILFLVPNVINAAIPEWAERYQKGKSIKNADDYYFGIGESIQSRGKADDNARKEFSKNVEVQVKCVESEIVKDKNGKVWEKFVSVSEVVTDVNLGGVSITERFKDPDTGTNYSIIQIRKDKYNKLVYDELQRKLEREINENKMAEAGEKEGIRKAQAQFKLWIQNEKNKIDHKIQQFKLKQNRKQEMAKLMEQYKKEYENFLNLQPPGKVLSFYNAELSAKSNRISLELGISPFSIQSVYYARKLWKLELAAYSEFSDNKYDRQDIVFKYQLLPNSGALYKTTFALGAIAYANSMDNDFKDLEIKFTPFVTGNITLPNLLFSYLSFYGDVRKYSIGLNSYVLYGHLQDKLSAILEFDYIADKDHRNKYGDEFLIQPGIRFKTANNVYSTLA